MPSWHRSTSFAWFSLACSSGWDCREVDGHALQQANVPHVELELPWATHGCDANPAGPGGQITTWAVERILAAAFQGAPRKAA